MIYQYDLYLNFQASYETLKEASEQTDVSYTSISKCLNGTDGRKTAGGFIWSYEPLDHMNLPKSKLPKVLLFDLETAPILAHVWRLWKQDVGINQIVSDFFIISWSAKWLFSDTVMSNRLTSKEALEQDDSRIVKNLWTLLNEAEIVIAHNGQYFDVPKINARFILHGLPPTSPYQIIDTLKVAQKEFGFSSNKLDYLCRLFGIEGKLETNFELWAGCVKGDEQSLTKMEAYNRHDVEMLEELYLKIRGWIKSHPNLQLYMEADEQVCPNCGSDYLKENGFYYTQTGKFQAFSCLSCGAVSRLRTAKMTLRANNMLKQSIAR